MPGTNSWHACCWPATTKSAARELDISDGTVKVHRQNIYHRLDVFSQSQLFRLFLDHVALVSRQQMS
ncbi:LuxR C-terminal-related transcriptional regulator [Halomonas sp. BC04]|uniref:LuxR C-terminal-related transcriptional regulator n=1 Tax=Halomonas sp. BC04 TaxID=1403540 RepID=UPI0003ED6540|nr:LuxR C-terminal-related transcriptional regulator [Halomonas sp. BC04]EWH01264.1 hypothetical protein Q427_15075 [Halomonas sp. BC04]